MSSTSDHNQSENAYPIDVESGAEMIRLLEQDRFMNGAMGGLFSERADLTGIHRIVDLACGPGGWAQEVAFTHPDREVLGVDISTAMIAYAQEQARNQGLDNLQFEVMNITKPLPLPDNTFDLINARAMVGFMPPDGWPLLVQECRRILRPGGVLRLTEGEWGFTNSAALEKLCSLSNRALFLAGRSLSPNGLNLGVTPMLSLFLRKAGYQRIQKKAHVLDSSAGSEGHYSYYKDVSAMFPLAQSFLLQVGMVTSREEFESLYQAALTEMLSEDFCSLSYVLTVWGEKP